MNYYGVAFAHTCALKQEARMRWYKEKPTRWHRDAPIEERAQLASEDPAHRDARELAIYCDAETKAQRARRYGHTEDPWILLLICAQDYDRRPRFAV